jgi:hypothetical protein
MRARTSSQIAPKFSTPAVEIQASDEGIRRELLVFNPARAFKWVVRNSKDTLAGERRTLLNTIQKGRVKIDV